jgi:hypothetical protein
MLHIGGNRMLLTKIKQTDLVKKMQLKWRDGIFLEKLKLEKNKKIHYLRELSESKKEVFKQTVYTLQTIDGVPLWEVNWKLKRLSKKGISDYSQNGVIKIPLSIKKSTTLATPIEINRIEKMIDELEGFEELRLHYFYQYKPYYKEKKMFGEISRWIEIHVYQGDIKLVR